MSQQTPSEYLHNSYMRLNTLFSIVDGEGFYVLKGHHFTVKEFNEMFPLAPKIRRKKEMSKENIDSTRAYLN